MPSLKDRMAAFQDASSPEKFEKEKQRDAAPPRRRGKSPPPAFLTQKNSKPKKPVKGKVVETKISPVRTRPKDWTYLYELAQNYDQFKLQEAEEKKAIAAKSPPPKSPKEKEQAATEENPEEEETVASPTKDIKGALEGIMGATYTAKTDWLDQAWISEKLISDEKYPNTLTFKFSDPKLFTRFTKTCDSERAAVIEKFVQELLAHERSKDITRLDLSNCMLPDAFLVVLCEAILKKPKDSLPKIQVLNLETNLLQGPGIQALSKVIRHDLTWRYLMVLMLENQKKTMTSDAEAALAEGIGNCPSIVVCSLRVRGAMEKKEIDDVIAYNIDQLRQARRQKAAKEGTLKERKRNETEQYFDKIAANDESITEVDLVGDIKFLALKSNEKTKSGSVFASNSRIKTVKMVKLGLDDSFAKALGESIAKNTTIEKLVIDSNAITGEGIKALFAGLGQNKSIVEFQVRHQSKTMASSDEQALPDLIESNTTIIKLGVDARDQLIKMKLDKKMNANREHQRKMRAAAKAAAAAEG